jgi:hypothetical protein
MSATLIVAEIFRRLHLMGLRSGAVHFTEATLLLVFALWTNRSDLPTDKGTPLGSSRYFVQYTKYIQDQEKHERDEERGLFD